MHAVNGYVRNAFLNQILNNRCFFLPYMPESAELEVAILKKRGILIQFISLQQALDLDGRNGI